MLDKKILDIDETDRDYVLEVLFSDGTLGECDFRPLLDKEAFKSLNQMKNFIAFSLEENAIVWNDELDVSYSWVWNNMDIIRKGSDEPDINFIINILETTGEELAKALELTPEDLEAFINKEKQPKGLLLKVLSTLQNNPATYRKYFV